MNLDIPLLLMKNAQSGYCQRLNYKFLLINPVKGRGDGQEGVPSTVVPTRHRRHNATRQKVTFTEADRDMSGWWGSI